MVEVWQWMTAFLLFSVLQNGSTNCEKMILPYANKVILDNDYSKILSNETSQSMEECSNNCCMNSDCDMAVYEDFLNCILYHCQISCDTISKEDSVLLEKRSEGDIILLIFILTF